MVLLLISKLFLIYRNIKKRIIKSEFSEYKTVKTTIIDFKKQNEHVCDCGLPLFIASLCLGRKGEFPSQEDFLVKLIGVS